MYDKCPIRDEDQERYPDKGLTLKKVGGSCVPAAQEIACHFSQDHARTLKLLDFFKNDVGPKVKESFWAYLE